VSSAPRTTPNSSGSLQPLEAASSVIPAGAFADLDESLSQSIEQPMQEAASAPASQSNPNAHPAQQYLTALFEKTDTVCLTFIHSTKTYASGGAVTENVFLPLSEVITNRGIKRLKERNRDWHIYVSMAPFKPDSKNRTKSNIAEVRHVFIDADENGDAILVAVRASVADAEIPAPTVIVQSSPHKYQFVWNVSGLTIPQQEALNRTLQHKFGTDAQAVDAARVLRIAGFRNIKSKYGDPKPVAKIVEYNEPPSVGLTIRDFKIPMTSEPENVIYLVASDAAVQQSIEFLEAAMDAASVSYTRKPWDGSGGAYKFLVALCPWRENHENGGQSDAMAIVQPSGAYGFKCLHDHCSEKGWDEFRAHLESLAGRKLPFGTKAEVPPKCQPDESGLVFHLPAVTNQSAFDFVLAPAEGQTDGWFPLGALSLIGASSGGTKTTLMYDMSIKQRMKLMFLGHATFGRPFLTTGVDRGTDSHERTMKRMRLSPEALPFKPISPILHDIAAAQAILNIIEEQNPLPEIAFIEGVDLMVTKPSDMLCVSAFTHALSQIARRYHIAIIGSGGAPKMKENNKYTLARDCFFGSVAWGRTTETLLTLSEIKKKGRRRLHVELRNAPDEDFTLEFQDGLLVPVKDEPNESGITDDSQLDIAWYKERARLAKTDPMKRWWTVLDFHRGRGISESTALRRVKHDHAKGHINEKPGKKVGRGGTHLYSWEESESNPIWRQERDEQKDAF
jgi:hypothetical protein